MLACIAGDTTPGDPNLVFGHQRFSFSVLNSGRESRKEATATRLDTIDAKHNTIATKAQSGYKQLAVLQFCSFAVLQFRGFARSRLMSNPFHDLR
jgi:hypothetical protein